ncbi:MAG: agmatine deiminase family protein [Firmicutes bacterium]|nr:agmatine deiminase family protein [Bacillota bacterium]MCM1400420.1 agmatine deiminase family protein [Bacteroides sp.]MCM1477632.1 agmatine deiminase family protein [Bacteroides sp.]
MSDAKSGGRLPAEWEKEGAVLLAWPHGATDWNYMLERVQACFKDMVEAMLPWTKIVVVAPDTAEAERFLGGSRGGRLFYVQAETNDTWARDYGPLSVETADGVMSVLDFRFNGWGLKFASCYDNQIVKALCDRRLITAPRQNMQWFVMEGGGLESDGQGTLMTTAHCQLSANRNPWLSREEIERTLLETFSAKKLIWLEHGYLAGDDTDSHIDTLARFAPYNTIIYTGCDDADDEHYEELQAMERELMQATTIDGQPFNLIRLPLPDAVFDEDGNRLPATYANFLALKHAVILPVYGQARKDALAKQMLQIAFDVPVVTVDCRALIEQHGSLHCMTMQMPSEILAI